MKHKYIFLLDVDGVLTSGNFFYSIEGKVLKEFGTNIPSNTEVRVWDSSAEMRYMVLPQQPNHAKKMSEEDLAKIVTRDSMIGVETL